jgi:hypothetical protein
MEVRAKIGGMWNEVLSVNGSLSKRRDREWKSQ